MSKDLQLLFIKNAKDLYVYRQIPQISNAGIVSMDKKNGNSYNWKHIELDYEYDSYILNKNLYKRYRLHNYYITIHAEEKLVYFEYNINQETCLTKFNYNFTQDITYRLLRRKRNFIFEHTQTEEFWIDQLHKLEDLLLRIKLLYS